MATPQERRFALLAVKRGALTEEQLADCVQMQKAKREQGSRIPLWDCAVLQDMLDADAAERLARAAGDLKTDKLGSYELLYMLGEGGMGAVYAGRGPDGERVAVKVLAPNLAKQRTYLTRFFREAQASCKLRHPNIVEGLEVGEQQGSYYFAMEYVNGPSLDEIIEQKGSLPPLQATRLVLQVAEGLAYAHEHGFVHRDIKPANIMLTRKGVAKLADLGLARQIDSEQTALTRTGTSLGTPFYMAPEQTTDAHRADERSDIYSLGATWYHAIAGHPPFEAETALQLMHKHTTEPLKPLVRETPGTPRPISRTVDRMMAKDPDDRIQSASEVCRIIRAECLEPRNVARELGLERPRQAETLWDVKIPIDGRLEKRRFSVPELRQLIRKGAVKRESPVRRAGSRDDYQPAAAFLELSREFPRDYASAPRAAAKTQASVTHQKLHNLVEHYDQERRSFRRRRALKRLIPYILEVGAVVLVAALAWAYREPIVAFVRRLTGGGA